MNSLASLLTQALAENNLSLTHEKKPLLINYLELLSKWNRVFNLTAITDSREMVYLHLIDSLIVAPFVKGEHCLDVGSGAGLPGIPLAILNPEQQWTVLDKNSKKTRFLTQSIAELKLNNVNVIHSACEQFHPGYGFDNILSRAFGTLSLFAETTSHLLANNGILIAMKGKYPEDELANLPNDIEVEKIERLPLKGYQSERHVVLMRKLRG